MVSPSPNVRHHIGWNPETHELRRSECGLGEVTCNMCQKGLRCGAAKMRLENYSKLSKHSTCHQGSSRLGDSSESRVAQLCVGGAQ